MGVHGVRLRLGQVELTHLPPHIPRDQLDGRLPFGDDMRRLLEASEAGLTASFLLGDGTQRVDLGLDITRHQLPVTTATTIQVDQVVRVPTGAYALATLLSLPGATLILLACCLHLLLGLLQTRNGFWGAARAASFSWCVDALDRLLHTAELLGSRRHGLLCCALFGGPGSRHRPAQLVLHMAEVRRVMRAEVLFHLRQPSWGLIAGRWDHFPFEQRQGIRHQSVPGVLSTRLGRVFQQDRVPHGVDRHQAQTAGQGFILRRGALLWRHLLGHADGFLTLVCHHGFCHVTVALLLRALGGAHQPIEPRDLPEQPHQANTTRTAFDKHHM